MTAGGGRRPGGHDLACYLDIMDPSVPSVLSFELQISHCDHMYRHRLDTLNLL